MRVIETLVTDLRTLIAEAGEDQGRITPSVYDTARVLRLYPPDAGVEPGLEWLLEQQQPDGGWGNTAVPLARDIPTLASVITLITRKSDYNQSTVESAIRRGCAFLRQQGELWKGPLPDDLPTGAEMVLIGLLDEAAALNISIDRAVYASLRALGERKRKYIARVQPEAGTAPSYTWEVWGQSPDPDILDGSGGVGHSPAATAAWLHRAEQRGGPAGARDAARTYLRDASRATGERIPGVVPTVWPIRRFEQTWVLYALFTAGLLNNERFGDLVDPLAQELAAALKPGGIGMSDYFIADGDITATTVAVLRATGRPVDISHLQNFRQNGHFITYAEELQSSITTTAHAVLALGIAGFKTTKPRQFLISQQDERGRWCGDKWHSSWLYTTASVVAALVHSGRRTAALSAACDAVLAAQRADGGWGIGPRATTSETAYALHMLLGLKKKGLWNRSVQVALERGYRWLLRQYRPFKADTTDERLWIGKEVYTPIRVDRAFELTALLAVALEKEPA